MKKKVALFMAIMLALPLFGAAPALAAEGNTLRVWCWDPAFNLYAMEEAAKVYKQINPEFELIIEEVPWDDLQMRLITIANSNALDDLPDIFLCQNNAFQKNMQNFPELFYDLTGSSIAFGEFPAGVLDFTIMDGKNYGVPFDNGTAINVIRTDVIAEAGYTIEDFTDITWTQFIARAKHVLTHTGKPMLSGVAGENDFIMVTLQSAGSSLFDDEGNPYIADNAELKAAIKVYGDLVRAGVFVEYNGWNEFVGSFNSGSVAGVLSGCWILGSVQVAEDQFGLWDITNLPRINGVEGATNYSAWGGSSWGVASSSKNPELAIDFLSKTFAGSVEFYATILGSAGAIANWMPAADGPMYQQPQAFFNDEPIYARIIEYGANVPSSNTGVYYYEARDAVGAAIQQILGGADMDAALREAEDAVNFAMGR